MFKYSLNCKGDSKARVRFSEELKRLGYKGSGGTNCESHLMISTNRNKSPHDEDQCVENGEYQFFWIAVDRNYEFNINNEWEFNAALGIAAIRNDKRYSVGEYLIFKETPTCAYNAKRDIVKVIDINHDGDDLYYGTDAEGMRFAENSVYDTEYLRRATPEEIIEHFKPKIASEDLLKEFGQIVANAVYTIPQTKTEKMKEIIGYKAPQDLFDGAVKKDRIFVRYRTSTSAFYHPKDSGDLYTLPKEIAEGWEPVYKEEEWKVGEWMKSNISGHLYRLNTINGDHLEPDGGEYFYDYQVTKPTPEEIEKHLIEVAKKKGFKDDVRFISVRDSVKSDWGAGFKETAIPERKERGIVGGDDHFNYNPEKDCLTTWGAGVHVVYEKGVWATLSPREKEIVVGSKDLKVTIGKGYIKARGMSLTVGKVSDMYNAYYNAGSGMRFNDGVHTYNVIAITDVRFIRIGCSQEDNLFSLEDLKLVIDTYNEVNK